MEIDSYGSVNLLDAQAWERDRRALDDLGGPP
jgi:hypothetical protein